MRHTRPAKGIGRDRFVNLVDQITQIEAPINTGYRVPILKKRKSSHQK